MPLPDVFAFCRSATQRQSHSLLMRRIVTATHEPPLDSDVLEKPFSLVLLEDPCYLYQNSWESTFYTTVPQQYGMTFVSVASEKSLSLSERVDSLKADVGQIPDALLVARGPQSSWVAQLYLESLFLRGLVMVDPILFDKPTAVEQENLNTLAKGTDAAWGEFTMEAKKRPLKLEPNSVPMLVMSSHETKLEASREVAARHGDQSGPYGDIEMVEIDDSSSAENQLNVIKTIDDWVNTIY
ncbi:MAG: hypothetical protein SGBAC_012839 [Bacillariaceae sp.]